MKTLYITPHLSTGGLPQYLVNCVEAKLRSKEEVWVVEWSNIAPIYKVQKDKLAALLGDRLIVWPQGTGESVKSSGLYKKITEVKPDVVHLEEFPEGFLPQDVINFIYGSNRTYKIYETTHDSNFELGKKTTKPDKFEFVSTFHSELFKDFGVYSEVVPYQVEKRSRGSREEGLKELGLDPDYRHVLNVGLFTPGKNQGEVFEIARELQDEKVVFHFVGNQAGNFADYWKPLNESKPSNCTLWGERSDVDSFYSCMDLLLFTSKSELMPLVPIEALSWGMEVLMYKDGIYEGRFEGSVEWLGKNVGENCDLVRRTLGFREKRKVKIKLVHLLTKIEDEREQKSIACLESLSNHGIDYVQCVNTPCEEYPTNLPALQEHKEKKPGYYGAYKAFRDGIEREFDEDLDLLVVCECDCVLGVDSEEFVSTLNKLSEVDFDYASFGQNEWSTKTTDIDGTFYRTNKIILAHCVVFPQKSRDFLLNQYSDLAWDSPDLWLDYAFAGQKKVVLHKPIAFQYEGFSLIDNEEKSGEYRIKENCEGKDDIRCEFSFLGGPKVSISGSSSLLYDIEFIDQDVDEVVYKSSITSQHWASANRKYFTNWLINVSYKGEKIASHSLSLKGKKVLVGFGSKSLGDTLAWFPYIEEFQKKHSCEIYVSTFWNKLFEKEYPNLHFILPGDVVNGVYAVYEIGCFDEGVGVGHKKDWRLIPLQKIATDILGLEYKELKPRVSIPDLPRSQKKDYVSVSEFSTMQCKFWNLPGGWEILVDKIRSMDLQVMSVSKERTTLKRARRCNGKSIEETIRNIYHSKAFIGVGSGLSWLAWALDVPVVLISGFSAAFCEFKDSPYVSRLINEDVCNGCFNDVEYYFDRGDWSWCPRDEDYVCSKSITVEQVLKGLKRVLK